MASVTSMGASTKRFTDVTAEQSWPPSGPPKKYTSTSVSPGWSIGSLFVSGVVVGLVGVVVVESVVRMVVVVVGTIVVEVGESPSEEDWARAGPQAASRIAKSAARAIRVVLVAVFSLRMVCLSCALFRLTPTISRSGYRLVTAT
jgi:hypothetical protein